MKKVKYPRYTREQNLSCKLSDFDIRVICLMKKGGKLVKDIAEIFEVSQQTIWYWLLSPEKRKERNRKQHLRYERFKDKKIVHEIQNRSVKRKREIMPKYIEYCKNKDLWRRKNYKLLTTM